MITVICKVVQLTTPSISLNDAMLLAVSATLSFNECSLFMVTLTFYECIWPYGCQTWHMPVAQPLTERQGNCLWNLLFLMSFSLAPRLSMSPFATSLQPLKSVMLTKTSLNALLHICQQTTAAAYSGSSTLQCVWCQTLASMTEV